MKPLVSILIPSFNHSKFIVETLDSTIGDTYPNKEIVIIDDGSTDNSVEIIKKWIEANPHQNINFGSRNNKGLTATLNELVQKARGKYLVILASDDLLTNNTIGERVKILQNSGKMVMVSDAEVINDKGMLIHRSLLSEFQNADKLKYHTADGILDEIIFNFSISGAVVIMDINVFKLIGKYPEDLKAEDLFFYTSAAANKQLLFYDKIVSRYRIHGNNTSGENPQLLIAVLKTYKRLFFKIPGFMRKLKLMRRVAGIIIKNPKIDIKSLLK